ncbi:unnamed protein product [Blepharisma stoltei]|uniref:Secreted protein n=1 Tax=Blepharisma stoltei TaxID=1481888 RepID=A0AAU9JTI9_9CILI|nr:unnamed protein product [Blepharisma stoltei]
MRKQDTVLGRFFFSAVLKGVSRPIWTFTQHNSEFCVLDLSFHSCRQLTRKFEVFHCTQFCDTLQGDTNPLIWGANGSIV